MIAKTLSFGSPGRLTVKNLQLVYPDVFAGEAGSLTKEMRRGLLSALTCDVRAGGVRRPLSIALAFSTASLAKYYLDKAEALVLPEFSE